MAISESVPNEFGACTAKPFGLCSVLLRSEPASAGLAYQTPNFIRRDDRSAAKPALHFVAGEMSHTLLPPHAGRAGVGSEAEGRPFSLPASCSLLLATSLFLKRHFFPVGILEVNHALGDI